MRIGYLIGALGMGGSERQLAELAVGMVSRGHEVEVACYDGPGTFDAFVERGGARIRWTGGRGKLGKIKGIRSWVADFRPDVLHGFMKRASSLAVLANLPARRARAVASDYSTASYARHRWDLWASLALWTLADRVVTQTEMNRRSLGLLAPWLRRRTEIVRNGVDVSRFSPPAVREPSPQFRFLVVGSVYAVKNPIRLVEAVRILSTRAARPFSVRWVGPIGSGGRPDGTHQAATDLVRRYGLEECVVFAGPSDRVEDEYRNADCLVHVSVQEGMPNAVVEGMACGLPIVVGRVSDLPRIVTAARNGFVCDEKEPVSIAEAMGAAMALDREELEAIAGRSRRLAEEWFAKERFLEDYESLYARLLGASTGPRPPMAAGL